MKFTRRSIIKKAGGAGLLLFMPGIIKAAYRLSEPDEDRSEEILEEWELELKKMDHMADVILINNNSVREFDMVSTGYDKERDNAPVVFFSKNDQWKPKKKTEINDFIKDIERFAKRNNVYIRYINDEESLNDNTTDCLIKRIKECGQFNEIREDLYRPVAIFYAERYKHFNLIN